MAGFSTQKVSGLLSMLNGIKNEALQLHCSHETVGKELSEVMSKATAGKGGGGGNRYKCHE